LNLGRVQNIKILGITVTNGLSVALHIQQLKPNSITLAGSKLVADRFEAKFHYAIWFEAGRRPASNQLRTSFEPASKQLRTSFEPDSVMEFGREPASSC